MHRICRLLALIGSVAWSQLASASPEGFYVGVSGGQASHDVEPGPGINIIWLFAGGGFIQHVDPATTEVEGPRWVGDALLGYRHNRFLAAELAYMDFGTVEVSEVFNVPFLFGSTFKEVQTHSSGVQGPAFSVLGTLPYTDDVGFFLRGGVLFADREITVRYGASETSPTFGTLTWLAGAGAEWAFAERWSIRAEYLQTGGVDADTAAGEVTLERVGLSLLFDL